MKKTLLFHFPCWKKFTLFLWSWIDSLLSVGFWGEEPKGCLNILVLLSLVPWRMSVGRRGCYRIRFRFSFVHLRRRGRSRLPELDDRRRRRGIFNHLILIRCLFLLGEKKLMLNDVSTFWFFIFIFICRS